MTDGDPLPSSAGSEQLPGPPGMRTRMVIEAARLFRERGYAGTSTRALAESLGITKTALYHYFTNKDALLLEICDESIARIDEAVRRAVFGIADPLDRLRTAVVAHVESALQDADMHATMLIEMRALPSDMRETVRQTRAGYEARIRGLIEAAQDAGSLRAQPTARWMTLALLNTLNWSIFWYRPDGDATRQEIGATLLDVFLNGVQTTVDHEARDVARPVPEPPTQLDRVEAKLDALLLDGPALSPLRSVRRPLR